MTSGLSTSSSTQVLDFEEFMESLFPEPSDQTDSSLTKALGKGFTLCLTFWVHSFFNLLYRVRNQAEILPYFHKSKLSGDQKICLDLKKYPREVGPTKKSVPKEPSPSVTNNFGETLEQTVVLETADVSRTTLVQNDLPTTPQPTEPTPTKTATYSLKSSGMCIPHPSKAATGGEDAHFYTANGCGVFDGVGGWAATGVMDAAAFASGLMTESKAEAVACLADSTEFDPQASLQSAFEKVVSRDIGGSSTALVVSLQDKGLLRASLVGDSGFVVVRNRHIVYRAPIQQHYFNCPFQLGRDSDKPKDACQIEVQVEQGDIIVSATDGFWDNFFEEDIVRSLWVWEWCEEQRKEEALAQFFCEKAYELSRRKDGLSPFAVASRNAGGHHKGGKTDDITVVVSQVVLQLPSA